MWHPKAQFPKDLVGGSNTEKRNYFKNGFFLKHDAVVEAYEDIKESFFEAPSKEIALIQGPTGVGKTGLSAHLMREAYEGVKVVDNQVSELPMIYVEADVLGGSSFSWKEFYRDLLRAMGELENIRIYGHPRPSGVDLGRAYSAGNRGEASLKKDFEKKLEEYNVKYVLIDEIHHMFKYGGVSGDKNLDVFKGISNRSGCRFLGLGTYEVSFSLGLSGQLARRMGIKNYPAYSLRKDGDIGKFAAAYSGLLAHMPLEMEPGVIKNAKAAFMGSCGCIGTLKGWLENALNFALKDSDRVLKVSHLESTRLENSQLKTIAEEIREGEATFAQPSEEEIWEILSGAPEVPVETHKKPTRKRRPGERSPGRDRVG